MHQLLLIEDNAGDARLICELLKHAGAGQFAVCRADRLSAGLQELSAKSFDAVILDLNLPDSQGLSTFSRLHAELPHLPIVILTGLEDTEAALQAVGAGAQDYLTKGDLTGSALARVVRYGIERARAEEARAYLASIVESSPDAITGEDLDGTIVSWNRGAETLYGYPAEEAIGRPVSMLLPPELTKEFFEMRERVKRGECVEHHETERVRKDGQRIAVSLTLSPIKEGGRVTGACSVARDITERKQLEQQLLQAQKLEAVGRLAGGMAHDFNNILGIILGYAELAQEKLPAEDPLAKQLAGIRNAAQRAATLTQQLLAFSRKQVMQPIVLNLNDVVAEVAKMLTRLIGENIELILRPAANLAAVKADPMQIEQVLMNLAVNAHDAMPKGGKLIIATANAELDEEYARNHPSVVPGSYVQLSVSDTGVGMSKETQAHLFEPFFTTKGLGKGTGLGLSIIYGIVKQSGGYIWVYSELDKGTTFKIYLPSVSEPAEARVPEAHPAVTTKQATETILLVEDEPSLAEMACAVLEGSGYKVLQAGSGEEALHVAESHSGQIDLLLSDVILPTGMDGTMLAERLLALRPNVKVIYMSGYSDVLLAADGRVRGESSLLAKPFSTAALRNKVREVLDSTPQGAAASQAQSAIV
ncbi:MAG: response regulator [Acidobacteriia bacterium]|nr:response regulator [Terriglobia bacterium]